MPLESPPDKENRGTWQHVSSAEKEIKDVIVLRSNLHADLLPLCSSGALGVFLEDVLCGSLERNNRELAQPVKASML